MKLVTRFCNVFAPTMLLLIAASGAECDDTAWGNLRGRVEFEGDALLIRPITVTKDKSVFGEHVIDDSLMIDSESNGVANVAIFLDPKPETSISIHPSYSESPSNEALVVAEAGRFRPRVTVMQTNQVIRLRNDDPVTHNFYYLTTRRNLGFNRLLESGKELRHTISFAERLPLSVDNGIYPWMQAWLVILDHPYVALSDERGAFEIKNLPLGKHRFRVWHESIHRSRIRVKSIAQNGRMIVPERQRFQLRVERSMNDPVQMKIVRAAE